MSYSKFMKNISVMRTIYICLAIVLACEVGFTLIRPHLLKASGGYGMLDTTVAFSVEQGYEHLANYGAEGNRYYDYLQLVDIAFPIALSFLLAMLIYVLYSAVFPDKEKMVLLGLIAFSGGFFDLLENAGIFMMRRSYPGSFDGLVLSVSVIGTVKTALYGLAVLLTFAGIVISVIKRKREKNN